MDATGLLIAPGAWFDAEMEIVNDGNVAFTYDVAIRLRGNANALSEQLQFTVTHPDGTVTEKRLSQLTEEFSLATGRMKVTDKAQTFRVKVEFLDEPENNLAQSQAAVFDLFVTAVQSTEQN